MDMTQFAFVIKRRGNMGGRSDGSGRSGGLFGGDGLF